MAEKMIATNTETKMNYTSIEQSKKLLEPDKIYLKECII